MAHHSVLLVEDNDELRALYKDAFSRNNFTVFEAADGQLAVDMAVMHKPEMIILDLMLPRQGGLGALRIFRSLPECKHTPIIVLTALPNPEYKEEAKSRVQGYYLKTEIKPKELVDKVLELLEARN